MPSGEYTLVVYHCYENYIACVNITCTSCVAVDLVVNCSTHCGSKTGPLLYFQITSTNTDEYPQFLVQIISNESPMFTCVTNAF